MNRHQVEVSGYDTMGYAPIVDFQTWRVAVLNYIDELEPHNINNFQCHSETDEVFVLLSGKCILFCAEIDQDHRISKINSWNMEANQAYTIKRGVYHTHTLSKEAKVLIVENSDTNDTNSPKIMINGAIQDELASMTRKLWASQV